MKSFLQSFYLFKTSEQACFKLWVILPPAEANMLCSILTYCRELALVIPYTIKSINGCHLLHRGKWEYLSGVGMWALEPQRNRFKRASCFPTSTIIQDYSEDTNMGGGGFCGFVFFPTTLKLYENWNLVVGLMHYGCGGCIKL